MRNLRYVLGLALLFLMILAPAVRAQEDSPEDPLLQDARQYAATYEVEVDEALSRLRLQSAIGKLNAELATRERQTFGGLWIQHSPSYRVTAQFTRKGGDNLQSYLQAEGMEDLAPLVDRRTVKLSLKRLEAIQAEANRIVRKQGIAAQSLINIAENRVELLTLRPADLVNAIAAESRTSKIAADLRLPANVEVIGVERLPRPQAYIYGGLEVSDCTSGFSVQSGSTLGISTAGHCDNTQSYNNRSLPYQNGQFSGAVDAQWHTAPDFHPTNRVWDGQFDTTTPNYRHITATKTRAQQVVGEFVCKFGITTGYTCGTIVSTNYAPTDYLPGATADFVKVDSSSQDQGEPGDSGGPWFSGETAYGLMSGGIVGGGGPGSPYNAAVYAPVDALTAIGVSVLTAPQDPAVGRWTYKDIGGNVNHYTAIHADEYECSIGGYAALDGDTNENGSGDIVQTYLYRQNNHWTIRGDWHTHNNGESWDFDLLCLKKANYPVSRFEWNNLGGNVNYNTGLSTTTYECGVSGMAALDGDIDEGGSADIIQSYMYRSAGTWRIRADFHSHNNGESWDIDAMCVQKWAPVSRYEFRNLGDSVNYNTFVSSSTYECGVAGIATRDADIQEHNSGNPIQAYLYKSGGNWWFRGDLRSHNDNESWDFDMLCIAK